MKHLLKRLSPLLLTILLLVPMFCIPASAASGSIHDILFDWEYYMNTQPDLKKAFGANPTALRQHYLSFGRREGRAPSVLFDPKYYVNLYPDLKAAFGSDYTALYNHFVNHGIAEGRRGSASFDLSVYKTYSDLRKAFGTAPSDNWEYLRHYMDYGRKEGRVAVKTSSAQSGSQQTPQTTTMYVKTSGPSSRLNMRSAAKTSASVVTKLSYGTAVTVHSTSSGWSRITVGGRTGYVSAQYLSSTNPYASSAVASNGLISPVPAGAKFRPQSDDNGWKGYHDISRNVSTGTPVYAITGGTAYYYQCHTNGKLRSYGNYVKFVSDDGVYEVRYAHLSGFNGMPTSITADTPHPCSGAAKTDPVGSRHVSAGETIGWIGTTGNSSAPHLHIEIYRNGARVDPTTLFPSLA